MPTSDDFEPTTPLRVLTEDEYLHRMAAAIRNVSSRIDRGMIVSLYRLPVERQQIYLDLAKHCIEVLDAHKKGPSP